MACLFCGREGNDFRTNARSIMRCRNILNISASAIEGANIFAMRQEMICDCEFMICARRDELEELKLKINEVAYRIILSQ